MTVSWTLPLTTICLRNLLQKKKKLKRMKRRKKKVKISYPKWKIILTTKLLSMKSEEKNKTRNWMKLQISNMRSTWKKDAKDKKKAFNLSTDLSGKLRKTTRLRKKIKIRKKWLMIRCITIFKKLCHKSKHSQLSLNNWSWTTLISQTTKLNKWLRWWTNSKSTLKLRPMSWERKESMMFSILIWKL